MKIMVYDVAAEYGGAMTVLRDFYQEVLEKSPREIQWVFALSQPVLEARPGVKVLCFPKPKKSHLHRLLFEHLDFPKILAQERPDVVISLQNMPVARYGGRQLVFLHQSLQFCEKTFSFLKREERSIALQQRIICRIYRRTPTGYLGLSGNVLTKIENGAKIVTEYPEAQIPALLEEIFGLAPCEYTK